MSGLHYESIGDLPEGARRQVVVKILARRVDAEAVNAEILKRKKAQRLLALKDAQLEGAISDLKVDHKLILREGYTSPEGKRIIAICCPVDFTYKVKLPIDHWPNCVDIDDLTFWHLCADSYGEGCKVAERVFLHPEQRVDEKLRGKGYIYREV